MAAEGTPELFSPGSSWGDSDMPEETLTLPEALHFLEERGVGFNLVGRYLGSSTTTVKKNLSVYFAVDTVVSSQDIIEGFDAAGLDVDDISSIQRKNSNNTWVVSFNSDCKERALALPSLQIAGCSVVLGDSENTTVIVKIYEAPDEMPDTMIIGRLSAYGTVLSFRRDKISAFLTRLEGSAFPSPFLLFSTLSLIPSLPPVFPFPLILRRLCCTGSGMLGT